jgi:hypothetical protein
MKKDIGKKIVAAVVGGLVIGGAVGGAVGYLLQPEPVQIVEYVDVVTEVEVIKEIPFNVTVEKIVEVQNEEALSLVCEKLMYDDIVECEVELKAEDEALALAFAEIESEGLDFVEDEGLFDDEDDLEFIRFYNDYDEVEVVKSDYDRDEYEFKIEVKIDDDETDDKYRVQYTVEVEDGEVEIVDAVIL